MSRPPVGLLLDVDGPIASPVDRAITQPTIVPDLLALLERGVPVVFNTGRSEDFLRREVIAPMMAAGVPKGARLHGVCEKGAVWFAVTADGEAPVRVDEALALPEAFAKRVEALVSERYADFVFYDHTKYAMVSVEQHLDLPSHEYLALQPEFDREVMAIFADLDLGVRRLDVEQPDAAGNIDWRVDPTIISTDIESVILGKDCGAERAFELLAHDGEVPQQWRTVGDSRTDYAMADWLHAQGYDVTHIDVRPVKPLPSTPYRVLASNASVNDEAGARYLRRLLQSLDDETVDEEGFDLNC